MKIRLDFVSNSSSSSFMLVGTPFSWKELEDAWNKMHPDQEFEDPEDLANELGLRCMRGIDNYYDEYCIGLTYDKMNANETRAQFEKRIADKLNTVFEVGNVYCMVDGGYEG